MWIPVSLKVCGRFDCSEPRWDDSRRFCKRHAKEWDKEAKAQGGAKILKWTTAKLWTR
jgi:hypothetical protein